MPGGSERDRPRPGHRSNPGGKRIGSQIPSPTPPIPFRWRAQSAEQLASETKRSTPAGATFTAPAAWSLRSEANMIVLTPPEPDSHLAIVDVKAADAASAVSTAWSAYRPDFKRPVKLMTPSPARDGWDERKNFDYETSPNERAVIRALAWRAGEKLDSGYPRRQGTYV